MKRNKVLKHLQKKICTGIAVGILILGICAGTAAEEKNDWRENDSARAASLPDLSTKKQRKVLTAIEDTIQRSREITIWENTKPEDTGEESLLIVAGAEKDDDGETATIGRPDNYKDPTFYKQVIMIGDSRTVGLSQVCESPEGVTVIWSCKGAMGYIWMRDTGAPQIEPYLAEDTAIVILMGVNDVHFINEYLEYVNQKSLDWALRGADTYFCTVGPLTTESLYVTNPEVIAFNEALHQGLNSNVKIIELYDHMVTHGFATFDGIHYSIPTDHDMFQYILSCLVNENGGVPGSIW